MSISPGLLNSCFQLLDILSRQKLAGEEVVRAWLDIGVTPTQQVLNACLAFRWLDLGEDGKLQLTGWGGAIREAESQRVKLRRAILNIIDTEEPVWIQNAQHGRAQVAAYLDSKTRQVFIEAELLNATDEETVKFWDSLASRARGLKDDRLLTIGRKGEVLSIDYESNRTKIVPRWIAVESNADGYDILSVVSATDPKHFSIEVKATTAGLNGLFHISRNEWERAALTEHHAFHLWDISKSKTRIAVVSPAQIEPHIAANRGSGEWESVEIPFSAFADGFSEYIQQ